MQKQSLYLITGNAKKLEEFIQILGDQFDFKNQNIDLPQIQGDPQQVAKQKVKIAYEKTKKAVITQDTSLCFNAYKGLPGPYVKWFLKSVGCEGLAKMVQPFQDKTGYAMCILAYMGPDVKQPVLFIGKTQGKIVQPRGSRDFGWDPVFQPSQPSAENKTYAQLPKQIKNTISHRFRAISEMKKYFSDKQSQMKDEKDEKNQKKDENKEQKVQKKEQKTQKKEEKHTEKKQQKSNKKEEKSHKKEQKSNKKNQQITQKRQTRSGRKVANKSEQKSPKKQQKQKTSAKKSKGK